MPTYTFLRKSTGENWLEELRIAEMVDKLKSDPDLDVVPAATPLGDPWRLGITRADNREHFREVIKGIKKNHPLNTIDGGSF